MRMLSLGTPILLLSSVFTLAQISPAPTDQNPTGNAQSTHKSQTATLEGCLSGTVDAFVLVDEKGRRYALTGDTNQLTGRVGHKVRVWGHPDHVVDAELITAGGPHFSFDVEKAHSLSVACK